MNSLLARLFLSTLTLLIASQGLSVSRVGGGKVSSTSSGFDMEIPSLFFSIKPWGTEGIRADGPPIMLGAGLTSQFMDVLEFQNEFSQMVTLTPAELRTQFLSLGWVEQPSTIPCAIHFYGRSSNMTAHVLSWGNGRGVVLRGLATNQVTAGLTQALATLTRHSQECSWK